MGREAIDVGAPPRCPPSHRLEHAWRPSCHTAPWPAPLTSPLPSLLASPAQPLLGPVGTLSRLVIRQLPSAAARLRRLLFSIYSQPQPTCRLFCGVVQHRCRPADWLTLCTCERGSGPCALRASFCSGPAEASPAPPSRPLHLLLRRCPFSHLVFDSAGAASQPRQAACRECRQLAKMNDLIW
jgi:hypothetical protein